ncbi:MAG TPA: VOC family protein [Thermoanaerobaculia bacterium]|nr:VOC family protein [Thermoanaerobaculia bacterium]
MTELEGERRHQRPESLRLRNLSASLTVDDLEASLRFYVDALGFTVEERMEEDGKLQGVMLVAGSCRLGLSQDDFAKGRGRAKGMGFRLWAETAQDLDAVARRLAEHGVEADGPKEEPWGGRTLTVVDPDGFKLTLSPAGES